MSGHVLDTSAILCYFEAEEGADQIEALLHDTRRHPVLMPFIALMEAEYVLRRRQSAAWVDDTMSAIDLWPVQVRESNPTWRREAARLKARGSLSLADAWIAALAILEDARLVHRDSEYDEIAGLQTLRLPDRATPRRRAR